MRNKCQTWTRGKESNVIASMTVSLAGNLPDAKPLMRDMIKEEFEDLSAVQRPTAWLHPKNARDFITNRMLPAESFEEISMTNKTGRGQIRIKIPE
jgi:hypothetical protein